MSNYYVTTSLPYVNGEPHLGHAMEFVMGDVLARHARQRGDTVIFSTGTDEHGGKIAEKAAELKITPKELADQMEAQFRKLAKTLDLSNDRFIRTTDRGHEQRAQLIWQALKKDIYRGKYSGWYCTGDEAFFTEAEVKANNGVCPSHNRPFEKVEEENYFFKLSKYTIPIRKSIESGDFRVIPDTKRNEIMNILKDGLEDISVSRPKEKISWGVPVPGDAQQVMYVWFEALMNYITVIGYPEQEEFKLFWPATTQIVGKDIARFHAAIWPGMLLGLGLALPRKLYIHGFINVDGKKMSKSLGNYVAPHEVIEKYGADAFRYYFLRHIPSYNDGDFSWQHFEAAYNNELADELGNAVQRTAAMLKRYQEGVVGEVPPAKHDIAQYERAIDDCRFDKALDEVWQQVRGLNQYIEEEKPWEIAKQDDQDHLREVLAYQVSSLLEIAELLMPFMPAASAKIKAVFKDGLVHMPKETLFPKLDTDKPAAKT
jgi:methionyl-tRNA synthetase